VSVLSGGGLVGLSFLAEQYAVYALHTEPGRFSGGEWAAWLATWAWAPTYLAAFTLLPLFFPDGRLPSPRWRPLLWAVAACIVVTSLSAALAPGNLTSAGVDNPLGVRWMPELRGWGEGVCLFVLAPLCLWALLSRYRRSSAVVRSQLKGVVVAVALVVAGPITALALGSGPLGTAWGPPRSLTGPG